MENLAKKPLEFIAHIAAGDARAALGGLETASKLSDKDSITLTNAQQAMQTTGVHYDKGGDEHYNTISAFIKSMRGSSAEAALFYLHRMLYESPRRKPWLTVYRRHPVSRPRRNFSKIFC